MRQLVSCVLNESTPSIWVAVHLAKNEPHVNEAWKKIVTKYQATFSVPRIECLVPKQVTSNTTLRFSASLFSVHSSNMQQEMEHVSFPYQLAISALPVASALLASEHAGMGSTCPESLERASVIALLSVYEMY